jgi:hypothetical protein
MPLPSSPPYKSQLVPRTCACPLFILSSRGLRFHKSSIYCQKLMSSSSLIFNMRTISMKINLALVFILIIATSSAIYTFFYLYLTITSVMGCSKLGLISWPSHLLSKVSSFIVMGRLHPPLSRMPQSDFKILYHYVHYEREYCH